MAINPLFSGPGQSKNPFPSFTPPRNRSTSASMAFPAPNKKPRISTEGEQAEVDPFQDFEDEESFTADDLEQIEIIESQALSQIPRDHITNATTSSISHVNGGPHVSHGFSFKPLASRSPNVPRKVSSGFPQKGPSRNPPTSSRGQARGQDSRNNNLRQTNVTVPVAELAPSKIYTGYLSSSPDGVKSSPPFASSQNRYKKGVEAQPTSRNPRLQQSNVSFPLHKQDSPQSQGFGVSNTMLHQDSDHQHSTNKTTFQHAMPPKEVRHIFLARTMAQGGVKNKMLTPPKGCTSSGTPNLPTQGETREAQRSLQLAEELEKMKEELKNLKSERFSKDGEIQVLRQNLGKSKAEVGRLKMEKMEQEERLKREQTEKDKELAKEAESLKTQLQFKERELAEAQSSYRGLEQRLQTSDNNNNSISKNPITPPRNSPRFKGASVGRRAGEQVPGGTPQQEGGFPTRESFMQTNPALGSPAKVKMRLVEESGKGMLRSPKRTASRSPARSPKIMMKQRKMPSSKLALRRDVTGSSKLTLSSRFPNGHMSSAQLIGRLMGQPQPQDDSAASPTQGSLISTLQTADCIHLDSCPALEEDETNKPASALAASKLLQKAEMNATSCKRNKNYESAMRALSSLLNFSTSSTGICANKLTSSKMEDSEPGYSCALNTDHCNAILGVLPLLEDQLTGYIDSLHLLSVCSSSLASTCPSSSGGGAGRGLDSSLETIAREEQLQFEMKERQAVRALQTLHCLVCYSPAAATHIIQSSGGEDGGGGGDADTSLMEIDPSAPLIDPTQAPGRSTSTQQVSTHPANPTSPMTPDLPKCQILKRLMKIVGMQTSEEQGLLVQNTALRILSELARRLPKEDAFRFSELLSSEILHPLLSYDSPSDTLCAVLTILSLVASKSWHLTQNFCTHSDTCLLLQVYQCASRNLNKCDTAEAMQVALKIINLLTCITTVHEEGAAFLLDTDCQCSEEVVSALVVMLSREFRSIDPDCDLHDQRLLVIRQGLLPLHSLFMDSHFTDHRLEAEQQYNHLIIEMNRLVAGLPQIHRHEVGFLQDFDGSDEDEWEQDSQEQATQMEVN